jgi:AAA15 family ATPase/GTPase
LASKKQSFDYKQSISGKGQITTLAGFAGSNASGKTNIMRLFSFLCYFICREEKDGSGMIKDIAYKTFFNNEKPSNFYIEFEANSCIFFYKLTIEKKLITHESLHIKKNNNKTPKTKIFLRELNKALYIKEEFFPHLKSDQLPQVRGDISTIAYLKRSQYKFDIINTVFDFFSNFESNIDELGRAWNNVYKFGVFNRYINDDVLKHEMETIIRGFDLGIKSFDIQPSNTDNNKKPFNVQAVHTINQKNNRLDFDYESRGTQSLFFTLAILLEGLKNNSVIIVDEMETGLHPESVNKLITLFNDRNINRTAQLIFSSHSLDFMRKLDMHQIYLVKKDSKCESDVVRLNTVDGIRPDQNHLAKYIAGSYGAFPKIEV